MKRLLAWLSDSWMCGMMYALHHRRRRETTTLDELDAYFLQWRGMSRGEFFSASPAKIAVAKAGMREWESPWECPEPENRVARAWFWESADGFRAPTVIIFHALMSVSDLGYRRIAAWFHRRGWNVVFPHLPYHYSRTPRNTWNGELAMTSHLIRNGNALRQAVREARQILRHLREQGCGTFGLLGTSYGGWVAGLLASLEPDLQFTALVQPIVDPESAIWETPAGKILRRHLQAQGITRSHIARHRELFAPIASVPLSGRSVVTLGQYDRIAPPHLLRGLAEAWKAEAMVEAEQGHFGYRAMRATLETLDEGGFLESTSRRV